MGRKKNEKNEMEWREKSNRKINAYSSSVVI